jgi:hypothetical protein
MVALVTQTWQGSWPTEAARVASASAPVPAMLLAQGLILSMPAARILASAPVVVLATSRKGRLRWHGGLRVVVGSEVVQGRARRPARPTETVSVAGSACTPTPAPLSPAEALAVVLMPPVVVSVLVSVTPCIAPVPIVALSA